MNKITILKSENTEPKKIRNMVFFSLLNFELKFQHRSKHSLLKNYEDKII